MLATRSKGLFDSKSQERLQKPPSCYISCSIRYRWLTADPGGPQSPRLSAVGLSRGSARHYRGAWQREWSVMPRKALETKNSKTFFIAHSKIYLRWLATSILDLHVTNNHSRGPSLRRQENTCCELAKASQLLLLKLYKILYVRSNHMKFLCFYVVGVTCSNV